MNFFTSRKLVMMALILLMVASSSFVFAKTSKDGRLGIRIQNLKPSLVKALDLDDDAGVLVDEVIPDSPADDAGLEDGDIIIECAGRTMDDISDLHRTVRRNDPGDEIDIVVIRDGREKTFTVELGESDLKNTITWMALDGNSPKTIKHHYSDGNFEVYFDNFGNDHGYLGIEMDDLKGQLGVYFGVEDNEGVLVTAVKEDSPAEDCGLAAGDVIVELNGQDTESISDLRQIMAETEAEDTIDIAVLRDGKTLDIEATLAEYPEDLNSCFFEQDANCIYMHGDKLKSFKNIEIKDGLLKHFDGTGSPRVLRLHDLHDNENAVEELREELKQLQEEIRQIKKERGDG